MNDLNDAKQTIYSSKTLYYTWVCILTVQLCTFSVS